MNSDTPFNPLPLPDGLMLSQETEPGQPAGQDPGQANPKPPPRRKAKRRSRGPRKPRPPVVDATAETRWNRMKARINARLAQIDPDTLKANAMAKNNNSNRTFTVHGPFEVPFESGKGGRYIPVDCSSFWHGDAQTVSHRKGCYVFAIRASKGFRPSYVGMTKENFKGECFTHHKIAQHYTPSLAQTGKGTPIMFLVTIDDKKGPPNKKNHP